MCAIFGCLGWGLTPLQVARTNQIMDHIIVASKERGRDGWGYHVQEERPDATGYNFERRSIVRDSVLPENEWFDPFHAIHQGCIIGNLRAEPTTEYVKDKHERDQQPYRFGKWNIVHNGTIANDKELRYRPEGLPLIGLPTEIDSAAIVELLAGTDTSTREAAAESFRQVVGKLVGSYAILATHDDYPGMVLAACNYRPIWYAILDGATFFASSRDYFPHGFSPQMLTPYSVWQFTPMNAVRLDNAQLAERPRALAICSGGMDSVVAAVAMVDAGYDVELLNFEYGSRAEDPERGAVFRVAQHLNVPLHILPMRIYNDKDSPLLRKDSTIAGGEEGAEYAHEWVPARNLVMLALATAYAEANGFEVLILGNNLEEAGAYPDNEPEFINRFNDMLPFAIGDGKRLRVVMPVGNMMKHEIVALGVQLGAPMEMTWSCYRSGPHHCGTCGPCFMRRTAYEINGLTDPLQYLKDS